MAKGKRRADIIAEHLQQFIQYELEIGRGRDDAVILREIWDHFLFQQLIQSAHGATTADNRGLAKALYNARKDGVSVLHLIDTYARKFIYPHRIKNTIRYDAGSRYHLH